MIAYWLLAGVTMVDLAFGLILAWRWTAIDVDDPRTPPPERDDDTNPVPSGDWDTALAVLVGAQPVNA